MAGVTEPGVTGVSQPGVAGTPRQHSSMTVQSGGNGAETGGGPSQDAPSVKNLSRKVQIVSI